MGITEIVCSCPQFLGTCGQLRLPKRKNKELGFFLAIFLACPFTDGKSKNSRKISTHVSLSSREASMGMGGQEGTSLTPPPAPEELYLNRLELLGAELFFFLWNYKNSFFSVRKKSFE